ncbi:MAG: benzoate-CoA ligase family protein [Alphaproteobacteria bacterium]
MSEHNVEIRPGKDGAELDFSKNFNVAVPFIDRHLGEGRGAKIAVLTADGQSVSYEALAANVNRCGNALLGLGLEPGARVLMVVKDCPEFFYLFWGAIKAGLVPVPLNTLLRAKDYEYIITDSQAAMVTYSPEFASEVEPAIAALESKPAHVLPCEGKGTTVCSLIEAGDPALDPAPANAGKECFWLYSSGSTGRPKGTVHCHRDMVVTSQLYGVDVLGVGEEDIHFSAAKLFFAYGLGNGMTFPLWVGGTAVLAAPRPTPELTFEVIEKFKPTLYYGVPTLYAAQLAALETASPDLSSIRYCVSAGESLPADIFRRWQEKTGLTILDGIGSTEILHIFLSNRPADVKPGTSGRPVPGYQARIVGDDGGEVKPGEAGTLQIRGDSNAVSYWNKPEKTKETMLAGGWLSTGDTYRQDSQGYFVYEGRSDDMMKVGGIWTSPVEIEAKLIEHPRVLEAAIVARADDADLIKPEAWVVLNQPGVAGEGAAKEALQAELLAHVKAGLAPYKYPRWWNFVDELPKTATGKIQRFKLRANG